MNDFSGNPKPPAVGRSRYPRHMHKGEWPNITTRTARDEAQEAALVAEGFSDRAPVIPPPPPPKPVLTPDQRLMAVEEELAVLRERLDALEARRGPGRPRKSEE